MGRSTEENGRDHNAMGRDIWHDYNDRQTFEHLLIDRKTTWLLTTESILFTAFALSFQADQGVKIFRIVLALCAMAFAVISAFGVERLVESKRKSFDQYAAFFALEEDVKLPPPLRDMPLQWGVDTVNTRRALLPDRVLPWVFFAAWCPLLVWSAMK